MNIEEVDEQHQILVGMINELHDAMEQAKSKEKSLDIINRMVEYTLFHFSTEENICSVLITLIMTNISLEHEKFVEKIVDLKQDYENGKTGISYEIFQALHYISLNFLKEWLVKHIVSTDKKYAALFIEKGLN